MRQYLVLGYATNQKDEVGKELYLGSERDEAVDTTNDESGSFVRKEMHELAVPFMKKHFDEKA